MKLKRNSIQPILSITLSIILFSLFLGIFIYILDKESTVLGKLELYKKISDLFLSENFNETKSTVLFIKVFSILLSLSSLIPLVLGVVNWKLYKNDFIEVNDKNILINNKNDVITLNINEIKNVEITRSKLIFYLNDGKINHFKTMYIKKNDTKEIVNVINEKIKLNKNTV